MELSQFYLDGEDQDETLEVNETETKETDESTEEEKAPTPEEFKKFRADSEKGVQKVIKQKKAMEFAMDNLSRLTDEPDYLLTINEQNKDAAQIILNKYYGGRTIQEFKDEILDVKSSKRESSEEQIDRQSIRKEVQEEMNQREIKRFINDFKKNISHHDEEIQEKIISEYDEYMDGKSSVDIDKVKKYAYRAYQDIIGTKFEESNKIAQMMSGGTKKGGEGKSSGTDEAKGDFKKAMGSMGRRFKQ